MSAAYETLIDALRDRGQHVAENGNGRKATAQCPSHDDGRASLSVTGVEGSVLLYCHAGCSTADVLGALKLDLRDLYDFRRDVTYTYPDDRRVHRSPDKRFRQSGNTKGRSLFRADRIGETGTVYVVEGEADVLAVEAAGGVAVCSAMGAGKAAKFDWSVLKGNVVVIVADKDKPGRRHATDIAGLLDGIAESVTIVEAATGKDAADHIAAGHTLDELVPLPREADGRENGGQRTGKSKADELHARRARITWADQIEAEPVRWAWTDGGHGRIPAGSLSVAAGREGTGKSSCGIWLASQITRGTLPGCYYGTPRRVFYVAVEDSWKHTIVPRGMAAKADLAMIGRFEVVTNTVGGDKESQESPVSLSLPYDNELLRAQIAEQDVALVVIDPLLSVIGGHIDTHRNREVRDALDPLVRMADETGAVIFGIAHFNKTSGTDAASLISGSGAFKDVPRSVFGFARDDENSQRIMTQVKNSLGRDNLPSRSYVIESTIVDTPKGSADTGRFLFTGQTDRTVADVLRDAHHAVAGQKLAANDFIAAYLGGAGGQALANDVIEAGESAGYKEQTLKNARGKVADTRSEGFKPKIWYWILREGTTEGTEGTKHNRVVPSVPSVPSVVPSETSGQSPAAESQTEPSQSSTPPGAPTDRTPGMTDRVKLALANAASGATRQCACGAELTCPGSVLAGRCRECVLIDQAAVAERVAGL